MKIYTIAKINMQRLLITTLICLSQLNRSFAQTNEFKMDTTRTSRESVAGLKAVETVSEFMNIILKGGPKESLISHCTVPFWQEEVGLVTTHVGLKTFLEALYTKSVPEFQKRQALLDTAYVVGVQKGMIDRLIALNTYFVAITIRFKPDGNKLTRKVIFAVQATDVEQIVGINL